MNQALVDVFERFDSGLYEEFHPLYSDNGITWNIVALAIAGVVLFIITLLTEIRATNCDDRLVSLYSVDRSVTLPAVIGTILNF